MANTTKATKKADKATSDNGEELEFEGDFNLEHGISKEDIIVDPQESFEAMKRAHAAAQPKMFEIVDFPIEEITLNEPGWNPNSNRAVQNIEFEYQGENRRYAVENSYFFNLLRKKIEDLAVSEEGAEILVPLPVKNILGKKLKLQKDGGYWLN